MEENRKTILFLRLLYRHESSSLTAWFDCDNSSKLSSLPIIRRIIGDAYFWNKIVVRAHK